MGRMVAYSLPLYLAVGPILEDPDRTVVVTENDMRAILGPDADLSHGVYPSHHGEELQKLVDSRFPGENLVIWSYGRP